MVAHVGHSKCDHVADKLDGVKLHQNQPKSFIKTPCSNIDVQQHAEHSVNIQERDHVMVAIIMDPDITFPAVDASIAQTKVYQDEEQMLSDLNQSNVCAPLVVISSTPPENILSEARLLHFFCMYGSEKLVTHPIVIPSKMICINSEDHLRNQLYQKLGQYYRDIAYHAFATNSRSQRDIECLLDKSTQCYKLLEDDARAVLNRYAKLLAADSKLNQSSKNPSHT
ncbi:unnamed protein product [Adineta ricciae]|uniref:Uncharacterized protein n=1 Tax=Adineta ricciae TaxID=249248 RepID=A0A814MEM2_ADIRI|nr:unnamed protein product [Adineta ricciae]CAF1662315.1 unnamed protein product [Adineta ricciae]